MDVVVVVVSASGVVLTTKGVRGQKKKTDCKRSGGGEREGGIKRVRLGSSFSLDRAQ